MNSLAQIADDLGLSKSTVSRALRGKPGVSASTVRAVKEAAERTGYIPSVTAAGLSTGRNEAVGVVIPSATRWFYTAVLSGVAKTLATSGYDVVLFDLQYTSESPRTFHKKLLRRRVDALIVLSTEFKSSEYAQFDTIGMPLIAVGGSVRQMPRIGVDDLAVARAATKHLIDLGHTRIGLVGGEDADGLNRVVPQRRTDGWTRELADANISPRPDWLISGGFRLLVAKQAVAELLCRVGDDRPTALVCLSDEMAMGAILAIREAGLAVPGDISVIGIDGHPFSEAFGLTTCEQDAEDQGVIAATAIVDRLGGRISSVSGSVAPFRLVVRSSTRALA
jgi:DNA-binding LacI/PurR family transcriptional regulator